MQLNMNEPYSRVYGSSKAAYFQVLNGRPLYFDADRRLISEEEAAEPNPEDLPGYVAPEPQRGTRDLAPADPPRDREAQLKAMHAVRIRDLVVAAGGEPATGDGSRAKNIAWLLANTA